MRWGKVPADHAGQFMVDCLAGNVLWFLSIGRLTFIWEVAA